MLSEQHTRLLVAYVDGELTRQERKLAVRLLRQSVAARKLFRDLQRDSRRLTALPRQTPPPDLARRVVSQVAQKSPPVPAVPSTLVPAASGSPSWLGLVLAASVLILVTTASYLYFSDDSDFAVPEPIAEKQPEPPLKPEEPQPAEKVEPRLQFALDDFQEKKVIREKLNAELKKENAVQLALTTRDNSKAIDNLKAAFQGNHIQLLIDAQVQQLIQDGKKAQFILFVEDLYPDQVTAIMEELAREKKEIRAVQTVALDVLTSDKRGELAGMLGLSLDQLEPARKSTKPDLPTNLPEKVPFTDPKQPGKKTDNSKTPTQQPPSGFAVVLAYDAQSSPTASSDEIKHFLKSRKTERTDGTLQLVILLNETPV